MFRHPHRCAFVIGALLVLLAAVLVVHFDFTTSHAQAHQYQRARIAQSVSQLNNGCLTCHAIVNDAPQIELGYSPVRSPDRPWQEANEAQAPTIASVSLLQDQLNSQLITTGQRILNLPDRRTQRSEMIVTDYLRVYEMASAARDPQSVQLALGRLDGIEHDLRVLEHQASPFQLVRQHIRHDQANPTALQTLTTMPGVAIVTPGQTIGEVAFVAFARPDTVQFAMPQAIVSAIYRRGPPAAAFLDSGL
jgi:hypothetical protein